MTQQYVALTDYGLSIECLTFLAFLVRLRSVPRLRFWFLVFFLSIAVSSLIGGTVHGFFAEPSFVGEKILWPLTMIGIGVTALSGVQIARAILWPDCKSAPADTAVYSAFCIYCGVVLFVSANFLIAILGYLPAILFLAWVLMKNYLRSHQRSFLTGFFGLAVILFASVIQQIKILDSSPYFNRNVLYHIMQGIGLLMVFVAARSLVGTEKDRQIYANKA
jgi:hypothetical protein